MEIFITVFSFTFSLLGLWWEIRNILKNKSLTISSLVGIMFVFTYGILPLAVMLMHISSGFSISTIYYLYDYSDDGLSQTFVWQTLGILAYIIIRYSTRKVNRVTSQNVARYDCSILQIATCFSLVIGVISIYLWSKAFGGILDLIKVASVVRSGLSHVDNRLAFFKHSARLVIITSFSSLLLVKKRHKTVFNMIMFLISFVFSILFLLANDGRMSFAMFFIIVIFISLDIFSEKEFTRKKLVLLCVMACMAMIFMLKLDSLTYYIKHGTFEPSSKNSFLESTVNEFAYIMISGQKAVNHASTLQLLIIDDILNGIQAWLPTSLKIFDVRNVWDYNTELTTKNFFGQFPCDFISTSLYDLSYAGPVAFGFAWGFIIKKIEKLKTKSTMCSVVSYYALSTSLFRLVDYCLLYDFVLGIFSIAVFAFIYLTTKSIFSRSN